MIKDEDIANDAEWYLNKSYRSASSSKCRISDDCCCKNVLLKLWRPSGGRAGWGESCHTSSDASSLSNLQVKDLYACLHYEWKPPHNAEDFLVTFLAVRQWMAAVTRITHGMWRPHADHQMNDGYSAYRNGG